MVPVAGRTHFSTNIKRRRGSDARKASPPRQTRKLRCCKQKAMGSTTHLHHHHHHHHHHLAAAARGQGRCPFSGWFWRRSGGRWSPSTVSCSSKASPFSSTPSSWGMLHRWGRQVHNVQVCRSVSWFLDEQTQCRTTTPCIQTPLTIYNLPYLRLCYTWWLHIFQNWQISADARKEGSLSWLW